MLIYIFVQSLETKFSIRHEINKCKITVVFNNDGGLEQTQMVLFALLRDEKI